MENEVHDEAFWLTKAPWTNETANLLLETVKPALPEAKLNYVKNYIAITVDGNTYLVLNKRSAGKSLLECWVGERLVEAAISLLDAKGIAYTVRKNRTVFMPIDKKMIEGSTSFFSQLAAIVQKAWSD